MFVRWFWWYEENGRAPRALGARVVKTEKEVLTRNDDDDEIIDVPVPKFSYQNLTYRDCMNLDME